MLETSIWAVLSSSQPPAGRCGGAATNALVDNRMSGWPLLMIGSTSITAAHTAATESFATTTPCLSRLHWWQPFGMMTATMSAQLRSWQAAHQGGTGAAPSVAILGKQVSQNESSSTVDALLALGKAKVTRSSQPWQKVDTLSWQSLTTSSTAYMVLTLMKSRSGVRRWCTGFAQSVLRVNCIGGRHPLRAAPRVRSAPTVAAEEHAFATPCRRTFLTLLRSGTGKEMS